MHTYGTLFHLVSIYCVQLCKCWSLVWSTYGTPALVYSKDKGPDPKSVEGFPLISMSIESDPECTCTKWLSGLHMIHSCKCESYHLHAQVIVCKNCTCNIVCVWMRTNLKIWMQVSIQYQMPDKNIFPFFFSILAKFVRTQYNLKSPGKVLDFLGNVWY